MDKDSVILKFDQETISDIENGVNSLSKSIDNNSNSILNLQDDLAEIYANLGKKQPVLQKKHLDICRSSQSVSTDYSNMSYDDCFEIARDSLEKRGFILDDFSYEDLVTDSELEEILDELNRPLSKRENWTKSDFIVVFIAASIGSLGDIILSNRDNKFTGTNSDFSKWLNSFHKHDGGAPIDYQGKGFGGGYHRGLSRGHDILRFIEAIIMFKKGEFVGIRHEAGQAIKVVSKVNQYGTPYEQLSTIEAIVKYAKHMFADLFSTCSLPFPGSSFLAECDNRQLRKFAADMYQNGFNCKNIMIQGLSTIIIEVIIRVYYSIKAVKKIKNKVDIDDDYSNFDKLKEFFKPSNKDKLNEMLLVAHALVTAVNIGKVVIKKAPWEINVTEIVSVVKYGVKVIKANNQRNSEFGKIIRNAEEIHSEWSALDKNLVNEEIVALNGLATLTVA